MHTVSTSAASSAASALPTLKPKRPRILLRFNEYSPSTFKLCARSLGAGFNDDYIFEISLPESIVAALISGRPVKDLVLKKECEVGAPGNYGY